MPGISLHDAIHGQRAIRRLADRGEKVVCMDINPRSASFDEYGDQVSVMYGDITQFEDVIKAILASKPDRILNLAYLLGSGDDTPHFTMKLNVLGMDNCFEAARVCGVKVETFSIGFGPKLFKWKWGDTVYAFSAIPLGGYVKMQGENELSDKANKNQNLDIDHERDYNNIPNYKKQIILFAVH